MEKSKSSISTMKATSMDRLVKIRKNFIRERNHHATGEEHCFEFVDKINGVNYINDSASTDVDSTWLALEKAEGKIVWIVGGADRGNDYTMLKELVRDKVSNIICLSSNVLKLFKTFADSNSKVIISCTNASEAVHDASFFAKEGDTVLLSPACPSYDLFEGIEDRGNQFKKAVQDLKEGKLVRTSW